MASEAGVPAAAAALYQERPDEFVAARNRLVRELRARGEREAAAQVSSLRRPTLSVWVANRLHDIASGPLEELLSAGSDLQAAQVGAAAGDAAARAQFRGLMARHSALIEDLVRAALAFLESEGYGVSEELARRLGGTLRTASTDPEGLGRQLAEGRLSADLEPAGFDLLQAPVDSPRVAARQAAVEASARAAEARREAEAEERAAVAARSRADELSRRARRLAEEARVAHEEAEAAAQEAFAAEERAEEARTRASALAKETG